MIRIWIYCAMIKAPILFTSVVNTHGYIYICIYIYVYIYISMCMCMCEYITCIYLHYFWSKVYVDTRGRVIIGGLEARFDSATIPQIHSWTLKTENFKWKRWKLFFQPPTDGRVYVSFGEGYSPRLLMIFMMLSVLPNYLRWFLISKF